MARQAKKPEKTARWRRWAGLAVLGAACVSTAWAGLKVRAYLATSSQFTLSRDDPNAIAIEGLRYAPRSLVIRVFAGDFNRSVFSIPLAERRRRLLGIDWVEDASVSRLWPGRLTVRIRERKPVAFVMPGSGLLLLIDANGVLLDPPAQAEFSFPVLSGIREDFTEPERRERVRAFLAFERDMGRDAKSISEVDAADPEDLLVVAQMGDRAVSLHMGDANYVRRYRNFARHYAEMAQAAPDARSFDLRLDDRITAKE
ncbi:MAG: cell division protein FtsQ/DivIB [Bryobacteraceae bacterium]|jgi:cell division protein FtsQ